MSTFNSASTAGSDLTSDDVLSELDWAAIDRFCCQYLQLETHLDFPHGRVLKTPEVQDEIFDRVFAGQSHSTINLRYQLHTVKELVRRIQASIRDEEYNKYEVSDRLMEWLGELVSLPQKPEAEEAQRKCIVSYHLSLLQRPETIEILEKRSLISAAGTTGLRTWEAALHLGQFLCINSRLVAGRRILELGAGTGYLSILCAKCLGAAHATASDGSEEVVDNLADNFALNHLDWDYSSSASANFRISPKLLKWGHALVGTEEPEWNSGRKTDLIIGADITYDQKVIPCLVATLKELLQLYQNAEIIIASTQRNLVTVSAFRDACIRSGLHIDELEFSTEEQREQLGRLNQPHRPLTPFYATQVPIRIFNISPVWNIKT